MFAIGIHDHPYYKTGLRAPSNKPALKLGKLLTGIVPAHPVTADHFRKLAFGLYANDRFGVCGPTSAANIVRLVTGGLLGKEIQPSQSDVFDLYRRSGNPNFDPTTGADDNGVDMQTMLEALLSGGIGDGKGGNVKPVAFAKVSAHNDQQIEAAVSIFGGVLWGVLLQTAQQSQSSMRPPVWDYSPSPTWGGHAVLNGAYEAADGSVIEDVISWKMRVQTLPLFRQHQLQECWAVIWPWNLSHPAFQAGVNVTQLAVDYKALTGKTLPGVGV